MWKVICLALPGRSEAMCRNRWARIRAAPNGPEDVDEYGRPPNRCTACGHLKKGHTCQAMRDLDVVGLKRERDFDLGILEEFVMELDVKEKPVEWSIEELVACMQCVE